MSLSHEHLSEIILHCNSQDWEILIQLPVSHTDISNYYLLKKTHNMHKMLLDEIISYPLRSYII